MLNNLRAAFSLLLLLAAAADVSWATTPASAQQRAGLAASSPAAGPSFVHQLKVMEDTKRVVRACAKSETVAQMAECSGYLVTQADFDSCVSTEQDAVCLVPRVCKANELPGGERGCARLDIGRTSSAAIVKYARPAADAVKGFAPEPVKLIQVTAEQKKQVDNCQDTHAQNRQALSACLAEAVMTSEQLEQFRCANEKKRDIIDIATGCLGKKLPMIALSAEERDVLRCAIFAKGPQRARSCVGKLVPSQENKMPADDLVEAVDCVFVNRSPETLGACLSGLTQPKSARAIARCGAMAVGVAPRTEDEILSCYDAAGVKPAEVAKIRNALRENAACAADVAKRGAEGIVKCAGGEKELEAAKQNLECMKGKSAREAPECISPDYARLRKCYDTFRGDPAQLAVKCSGIEVTDPLAKAAVGCSAAMSFRPDADYADILNKCGRSFGEAEDLARKVEGAKEKVDAAIAKVKAAQTQLAKCKADFDKQPDPTPQDRINFGRCVTTGQQLPPEVSCAMQVGNQRDASALLDQCADVLSKKFGDGVKKAAAAYACYEKHRDNVNAAMACAAAPHLSGKAAQQLACASKGSSAQVALCLAGPKLPGQTGAFVACAVESKSTTGGLGCAAKVAFPQVFKGMNKEWQAVAECAATTAGEPNSMATCVGTRLLMNEISACLKGGIGRSGCFGPNNTIVKFWTNYWRAILKPSMGRNNEFRRFLRSVDKDVLQPVGDFVSGAGRALGDFAKSAGEAAQRAGQKLIDNIVPGR